MTVAVDDLEAVGVGSVLSERLDEPQTVRELTIYVEGGRRAPPGAVRRRGGQSQLTRELARVVASSRARSSSAAGATAWSGSRWTGSAQPVRQGAGLPEALPISMWPGVAGAHAAPQLGAEVLVEFLEGDRTQPIVTGFAGKDGVGTRPTASRSPWARCCAPGTPRASFRGEGRRGARPTRTIVTAFNTHTQRRDPRRRSRAFGDARRAGQCRRIEGEGLVNATVADAIATEIAALTREVARLSRPFELRRRHLVRA